MTSTVYIAKNVYGGDGLGRLGDGRVVFVPGAWAGEQVRAEIVEEKKHYVKARLVEVVEKSPDRLESAGDTRLPGMVYADLSYKIKSWDAWGDHKAQVAWPEIVRPCAGGFHCGRVAGPPGVYPFFE